MTNWRVDMYWVDVLKIISLKCLLSSCGSSLLCQAWLPDCDGKASIISSIHCLIHDFTAHSCFLCDAVCEKLLSYIFTFTKTVLSAVIHTSIDIIVNKTVGQKIFNCWSCEVCWSTLYHILFNMCCQCRLMSVMCYVNTYELDYMVLCQTANNNNIKKML